MVRPSSKVVARTNISARSMLEPSVGLTFGMAIRFTAARPMARKVISSTS